MKTEKQVRTWYMDTDLLESALDKCDLGDGYSCKVRMYPHKDMISELTKVIIYDDYIKMQEQADMLAGAVQKAKDWFHGYGERAEFEDALAAYNKVKERMK